MADRTDELRDDIEYRRESISQTVDQIENRVSPSRIAARGRYRARQRLYDMKDRIMGNESRDYPWQTYDDSPGVRERASGITDSVSSSVSSAGDTVSQGLSSAGDTLGDVPQMVRRQARGNPLAAGIIAFGGGLLVGTLAPRTQPERRVARQVEPLVSDVVDEAKERGQSIAEDLKEPARRAADQVKESAKSGAQSVQEDAKEAAQRAKDEATS